MESPHKRPRYFTPVRMKKQDSQFSNFRRFIDQLVFTEINNESDLLLALSAKFGTDFTSIAIQAIKHVPAKFPNRWIYVSNIVKVINATCTDVQLNLLLKHINTIVNVDIHTGAVPEETLWDATYLSKRTHMAFLVTKVDTCMVKGCGGNLFGSLKDTTDVTVFTLRGPVPYLKATLKCKNCCTRYGIDKYHIAHGKSYMYPDRFKPDVIMASSKVFFSLDTFEMLCESGNHAFVSAQGFAEIYNSTFHAEHPVVKSYVRLNEISNAPSENTAGYRMTYKIALEVLFNGELENELRERDLIATLGMQKDSDRERVMKTVDQLRRSELYPHDKKDCSEQCRTKGCQNLRIIDGCWKLCIPHCMMAVRTEVDGYPLVNFPNVCVEEPKPGSVFCDEHFSFLQKHGVPTDKQEFLKHIGCKANPSTQVDIKHVDDRLLSFMEELDGTHQDDTIGTSAMAYQGTDNIIQKMPQGTLHDKEDMPVCNKNTGEKGRGVYGKEHVDILSQYQAVETFYTLTHSTMDRLLAMDVDTDHSSEREIPDITPQSPLQSPLQSPVSTSEQEAGNTTRPPPLSPIVILSPLTITCLPPRHVGEDETEESVHIPMASTPLPSPRHIPPVQTNTDRSTELIPATTPLPSPIPAAPFNSDPSPVILPVPRKSQRGKGTVSKTKARWCTCKKTVKWKMIGCDGEQCDIEWFHVKCVGLTKIPKGEWFCEPCKARL